MIAARTAPAHAGKSLTWLVIVAALVVALGAMLHPLPQVGSPLSEHALLSHQSDADIARQCLDGRDGWLFYNPQSGRFAFVCWLSDRWGIVILSLTLAVITAFVTKKLKDIERVRKYMRRQGYEEL